MERSIKNIIATKAANIYEINDSSVKGYGNVFNVIDSDRDRLHYGAFSKAIKDQFVDKTDPILPMYLAYHDFTKPLANFKELKEDYKGLWFETENFINATHAKDVFAAIEKKVIAQNSVRFKYDFDAMQYNQDEDVWEIFGIKKLFEISAVPIGANPYSSIEKTAGFKESLLSEMQNFINEIEGINQIKAYSLFEKVKAAFEISEFKKDFVDEVQKHNGDFTEILTEIANTKLNF